ncbi:MAG TPA: glycosyltransferase family 39 protein [Steroidobacteraceae bacterium]|jgi:hypothetical protein|nr:glycosyltransferase family 39 protein [Steroidobacteraceae bacterium]
MKPAQTSSGGARTPLGGAPGFAPRGGAVGILLLAVVPAALAFGIYGRFKGLGTWPLGVDEFYMSRSIDHVLSTGLPRFPCGGYYSRGILFQYLTAALRTAGLSAELAGRLLAALGSIAVLPAAFLLARRIKGPLSGWLTVAILCASVWEIEMARFGRMYAPFQAVFCWYLVCYLRYVDDGRRKAFIWMIALSFVGVLTWEGGSLLGVATVLAIVQSHERGRLRRADWGRLALALVVLALLYAATRDLRGPAGAEIGGEPSAPEGAHGIGLWISAIRAHIVWAGAFVLPLAMSVPALRFIVLQRGRWLAAAGWLIAVLAALAHAFPAAAGVLALMWLAGLTEWTELRSAGARPLWIALAAALVFWAACDLATGTSLRSLIDMPDLFERIAHPWGRAMPMMTVAVTLAVVYWFIRWARAPGETPPVVRPLLALLLLLTLAVGAIPTERIETRYTFFLYPLLIALGVSALLDLGARTLRRRTGAPSAALSAAPTAGQPAAPSAAPTAGQPAAPHMGEAPSRFVTGGFLIALLPLVCFALTEDLQLRHVAHIDSAAANYRIGLKPARADHYYPRNDMRGVAAWLSAHVRPGDVVVSGIPNLDAYYPSFDFFYLDEDDNRYDAYVCADSRTDRWTNRPVLFGPDRLKSYVESGRGVYATVYSDTEQRLSAAARRAGWSVTRVYTAMDGKTDVLRIGTAGGAN